jgi:hypothetical protein
MDGLLKKVNPGSVVILSGFPSHTLFCMKLQDKPGQINTLASENGRLAGFSWLGKQIVVRPALCLALWV